MMKATLLFLFLGMVLEGAASTPSRDNLDLAANRRARAANNQAASTPSRDNLALAASRRARAAQDESKALTTADEKSWEMLTSDEKVKLINTRCGIVASCNGKITCIPKAQSVKVKILAPGS